jgi:hypothetical protein
MSIQINRIDDHTYSINIPEPMNEDLSQSDVNTINIYSETIVNIWNNNTTIDFQLRDGDKLEVNYLNRKVYLNLTTQVWMYSSNT